MIDTIIVILFLTVDVATCIYSRRNVNNGNDFHDSGTQPGCNGKHDDNEKLWCRLWPFWWMRKICRAGLRSACVQSQCLLLRPAVLSFISEPGGRGCDDRSNRLDGAVKVWKLLTTAMIDSGRLLLSFFVLHWRFILLPIANESWI